MIGIALSDDAIGDEVNRIVNVTEEIDLNEIVAETTDESAGLHVVSAIVDAKRVNPEICGRRNNETSSLRKRFLSSTRSNQKDFGWLVLLLGPNGVMSGNLINSQWVLTCAKFAEYRYIDSDYAFCV